MRASRGPRETAYAKLNLALHIRERMPDGYHRIETLFAFCVDGDTIEAEAADSIGLSIHGPFAADAPMDGTNLVLRAARSLAKAFDIELGARLSLAKNLPIASGIGGGSADAAATLRLLARLWELPRDDPRIAELAHALGADVPACLYSVTAIGRGRGDELRALPVSRLTGAPALLVNPRQPLATERVYGGWDGEDRGALDDEEALAIALAGRSDLELVAKGLLPVIGDILRLLADQPGVVLARMSGSGATCFALFDSREERDAADEAIGGSHPNWWRLATELR